MSANARFAALAAAASRQARQTLTDTRPQSERYGEDTFSIEEARKRLPKDIFKKFRETLDSNHPLDPEIAAVVAHAMKEWALSRGVTHYTHWFQPMTGVTAEKHDSFLNVDPSGVIERFNARELVQGEPDASSFPSGGLRATFEARGYTAWDPVTPAFLVQHPNSGATLTIPSAFVSYTGESLDEKTPLLRSSEALSRAATRLLGLMGRTDVKRVVTTVGPEQEYFLVDRALYNLRPDLVACGRTVFGAPPPKGQELEDQYFGAIKERIVTFMADVESQLIALGIPVKTRHNEVAPAQYECAPIFELSNKAADHNQIMLEVFRKTALRHELAFLDHEKPFKGINGSGKHNNWSMATEHGENLLEPGHTPAENLQFLCFLVATVNAVHTHGGLLRASVASAGNDHRLGANEAPPAIMSVFVGEDLTGVLDTIEKGAGSADSRRHTIALGVTTLPHIAKDTTDRNRTSPFAFTGNKFEFRAVGSSANISMSNTIINTTVAEAIDALTAELDSTMRRDGVDFAEAAARVLPGLITAARPVLFNGDNYTTEWHEEAARRGLPNDKDTPTALRHFVTQVTLALFDKYNVLSRSEMESRYRVRLENYCKRVAIEARVALEMARTGVMPAALSYLERLGRVRGSVVAPSAASPLAEIEQQVLDLVAAAHTGTKRLEAALHEAHDKDGIDAEAEAMRTAVTGALASLRSAVDGLEALVDDTLWPYPKYRELLFCA